MLFEGTDDRFPIFADELRVLILEIEHELDVDVQDAGVVLGPLDVAPHPVKRVGDPA